MGREVVGNEWISLTARLIGDDLGQEGHELLGWYGARRFCPALRRLGVERGVQRERAVAIVLKAVALSSPGRQRQHRIKAIQGLDRGLLIDAEHRRMLRRVDVQPDHIGRLELEVRVVRGHVALHPMGLKPGALPDPRHHHVADPQCRRQLAAAPVRGAIRRGRRVQSRMRASSAGVRFSTARPRMVGKQARQPLSFETTLPATDIVGVAAQNLANRQVGFTLRQQQDQPRAAHILGRQRARAQPIPQVPCAHSASSETLLRHAS